MKPDSVVLEIAVVEIDARQLPILDELFAVLDAQSLPLEVRQNLDRNGFRAAVISSHMPSQLQLLLAEDPIDPDSLTDIQRAMWEAGLLKPTSKLLTHQRITNQAGESHPVVVSNPLAVLHWQAEEPQGRRSGVCEDARCALGVQTYPLGDGSVRLVITPEIHHGPVMPRVAVVDNSLLYKNRQHRIGFEPLSVDVTVRTGQTVIVAPASDVAGLASQFFTVPVEPDGRGEPGQRVRFLLVRLVETQRDELFSPEFGGGPLAVPTD